MNKILLLVLILYTAPCLFACSETETWYCKKDGKTLYSVSASGEIGSADKGCSCDEIRYFEASTFGEVDDEALAEDFGC
ncbi:MAG: hypothetical protein ACR2PU_00305 [Gammaproteobacteria bacterium]